MGLANPAEVLLELTPFSWVVDYLSNTGKWVQSLAPLQGARWIEGSMSLVQRVQSIGPWRPKPSPGVDVRRMPAAGGSFDAGRFDRVVPLRSWMWFVLAHLLPGL